MRYALLGEKLGHSLSPQLHRLLGECEYELLEVKPSQISDTLHDTHYDGFNLTIPYKKTVLPLLDEVDEKACLIGSVNTVVRQPDGKLKGYNTDYYGLCRLMEQIDLSFAKQKVLVLGSGGTSATACAVLDDLHAKPIVISRSGKNNYQNLKNHADAFAIVNTTPVGMFPNCDHNPVDLRMFPSLQAVIDVVYNPLKTRFVMQAEALGIKAVGGLPMLVRQAVYARCLWENCASNDFPEAKVLSALTLESQNIVMIGMPGCGKTTIGRMIAKKLERPFIDLDEWIIEKTGCSIERIFAEKGEAGFRQVEKEITAESSLLRGAVISTGGGTLLDAENSMRLKQNGYFIWIQRPIEALSSAGRPISQKTGLQLLWEQRKPIYESVCDATVKNEDTLERCCMEAIAKWKNQA